ncbi:MAG: hypothetical protein HY303_05530 [Candidatus Wallbacteria bacterium]|nr:hypothetical protein [Candidatus Wallbacteria bacterium]
MFRQIEHIAFLPLIAVSRVVAMVVRPFAAFGLHHLSLLLLASAVYGLVHPYWAGILRFLNID